MSNFREYMIIGGMPAIVNRFVTQKNYSGTLLAYIKKYLRKREKRTRLLSLFLEFRNSNFEFLW